MGAVYTSNTYAVKTQTFNTDTLLINPENNTDERINILDYFTDNNIKLSKDYSFTVEPTYNTDGSISYFNVSNGNVFLEDKQIIKIPGKSHLEMNSTDGTSQYVVLNVFNNSDGNITYSYNAVNEEELPGLGYTFLSPSEVNPVNYDISEANGYAPDASKWNKEIYVPNNLTIVSVVNGVAYDGLV